MQAKLKSQWDKEDVEKAIEKMGSAVVEAALAPSYSGKFKVLSVKKLVRQGIPFELRPRVWTMLIHMGAIEGFFLSFSFHFFFSPDFADFSFLLQDTILTSRLARGEHLVAKH